LVINQKRLTNQQTSDAFPRPYIDNRNFYGFKKTQGATNLTDLLEDILEEFLRRKEKEGANTESLARSGKRSNA